MATGSHILYATLVESIIQVRADLTADLMEIISVISKMDTFEEDREKIHQLIGLPYKAGLQYHDMEEITGSKLSTEDWTKLFFKNVTLETKDKLRKIYKYDFEMYNYDSFKY